MCQMNQPINCNIIIERFIVHSPLVNISDVIFFIIKIYIEAALAYPNYKDHKMIHNRTQALGAVLLKNVTMIVNSGVNVFQCFPF